MDLLYTYKVKKMKASLAHFTEHTTPGGALAWQFFWL